MYICGKNVRTLVTQGFTLWELHQMWFGNKSSVGPLAFLSTSCSFKSLLVNRSINPSSSAWTSFWPKISESYYPLFPNQSHPSRFSFVPSLSYYRSPPGWEWAETQPVRVRPPGDHIGIKFFTIVKKNHFHQSHQQKIIKISQFELEQSWNDWNGKTKFPNCRLRSPSFWWRVFPKAKQTTFAIFKLPSKLRSDLSWRRCLWENKNCAIIVREKIFWKNYPGSILRPSSPGDAGA